ncbi:hypothetical protein MGU_11314 [Metarhizium guizhouense ARSEF 977]|uniref:Uncharacterized protein n=1 Tax=Metarhizium guizhouense (strain ARSEF 977) TaxID=1276136 RepID=A0A0B4G400_METGA|nr:hypothetical protein MGU_11314 [Metarhizium guizhouense ARSEF 977]
MTAPINVLIIGPTQNGKSTLINRIRNLADHGDTESARVGNGMTSLTTRCNVYDLHVPITKYKLVDMNNFTDINIPDDEGKLFELDGIWDNQDMDVQPIDQNAPRLHVRLIDTPGLDDSRGRDKDMQNIWTVLKFLTATAESETPWDRYISTILFVCNANKAFSSDFQEIFKYYKQCMPNLFGSLAIINTHFSIDKWHQKYTRWIPSQLSNVGHTAKDDVIQARRASFLDTLGINPQHFFIDSKPRARFPFEEVVSRNDLSEIITFLSFKDPMPIAQMRLVKRGPWMAVDWLLVSYLNTIKNEWQKEYKSRSDAASDNVKLRDISRTRLHNWATELKECEEKLEIYDSETTYNLVSYNTRDRVDTSTRFLKYATFQKIKGTFPITEAERPFYVKTQPRSDTDAAYWTGHTETSTTWTGSFEAKWGKVPNLNAQSWTKNMYHYKDAISVLRKRRRELEINLAKERQILQRLEGRVVDDDDPRMKALSGWLSKCDEWIKRLKSDECDLKKGFTQAASERYAKLYSAITPRDLFQMVLEEDEDFEAELQSVKRLLPRSDQA